MLVCTSFSWSQFNVNWVWQNISLAFHCKPLWERLSWDCRFMEGVEGKLQSWAQSRFCREKRLVYSAICPINVFGSVNIHTMSSMCSTPHIEKANTPSKITPLFPWISLYLDRFLQKCWILQTDFSPCHFLDAWVSVLTGMRV